MSTVSTIISGGEKHPIYFGMLELENYEQLTGTTVGDLLAKAQVLSTVTEENFKWPFTTTEMINVAYVGLNGGARKQKRKNEYTREEAAEIIDEGKAVFMQIFTAFGQSAARSYGGEVEEDLAGNAPSPKRRASAKK